jgi:hypothetical protein
LARLAGQFLWRFRQRHPAEERGPVIQYGRENQAGDHQRHKQRAGPWP